jgi:glucosamine 6-phosphate synthetase-like amidotransferase/phosphosugar isomerase protein
VCGIFGFTLTEPVSLTKAFKVLEKLEVHQYPNETKPVGGYGAGLAVLRKDGSILLEKIGKADAASPVRRLSRIVKAKEAAVLVAHVRMPSPQFMETARFRETAQPYATECYRDLTIVSAHNGYIENYKIIREKLDKTHVLECERVELVDSEVIPHYFEELLREKGDTGEALDALHSSLEGRMALSLLQVGNKGVFLHLVHKGKTRGLVVWTNSSGEVVFCSRKEPLTAEFADVLAEGTFEEKVSIPWEKQKDMIISYAIKAKA